VTIALRDPRAVSLESEGGVFLPAGGVGDAGSAKEHELSPLRAVDGSIAVRTSIRRLVEHRTITLVPADGHIQWMFTDSSERADAADVLRRVGLESRALALPVEVGLTPPVAGISQPTIRLGCRSGGVCLRLVTPWENVITIREETVFDSNAAARPDAARYFRGHHYAYAYSEPKPLRTVFYPPKTSLRPESSDASTP
jgi:hypothetical protein